MFEEVTVIDRDPLPDEPIARRGVPQARHIHVLLEAARITCEDLFPGFTEDLLSAGAVMHDVTWDVKFYMDGDFLAKGPQRRSVFAATRPVYEHVIRQRLSDLDGVHFRPNCQFTEYLVDGAAMTVNGVLVQSKDREPEQLPADLVVDTTGRTSRTPKWLGEHGFTPPPIDEVHVDVAYSTTFIERPTGDRRGMTVPPTPQQPRGGSFAPVEDGRWLMTLWGMHGNDPLR